MQAEGIIAAIVGALSGGGGMRLLGRLVGPERDAGIAKYYRGVISGMQKENTQLRKRIRGLEERVEELRELEARIAELELCQDDPPAHLS